MPELNGRGGFVNLLPARAGAFEKAFGKVGFRNLCTGEVGSFLGMSGGDFWLRLGLERGGA